MTTRVIRNGRPILAALSAAVLGAGCATVPPGGEIRVAQDVDIERFMGDWYVISSIPTFIETKAYNAVETYELNSDGTINTTFTFRKGGFDGKEKKYNPKGFVREGTGNAIWGMRFIWPIKADYRIVYVSDDYSTTIIGRNKRDFVWIMARTPEIPSQDYIDLVEIIREEGYDTSKLREVPQRWTD